MRITLNIDNQTQERASQLTGIKEKTQLLHEGLKLLIAMESAKQLTLLGGTAPGIEDIPRR